MFDIINNRILSERESSVHVPRPSLYCVWIRAHEGECAPLIQVWIDPSMSMFDSRTVNAPDLAAQPEAHAALAPIDNS